jgi:hypothetical protein
MNSISDLDRRISRALETGKGMQLSAADLDLLTISGAYEAVAMAAAAELKDVAMRRRADGPSSRDT